MCAPAHTIVSFLLTRVSDLDGATVWYADVLNHRQLRLGWADFSFLLTIRHANATPSWGWMTLLSF